MTYKLGRHCRQCRGSQPSTSSCGPPRPPVWRGPPRMSTFDQPLPATASPEVEFISLSHLNPSTELAPVPSRGIDLTYFRRYVRALEDGGYDYTLLPYGSHSRPPFLGAAGVGPRHARA